MTFLEFTKVFHSWNEDEELKIYVHEIEMDCDRLPVLMSKYSQATLDHVDGNSIYLRKVFSSPYFSEFYNMLVAFERKWGLLLKETPNSRIAHEAHSEFEYLLDQFNIACKTAL